MAVAAVMMAACLLVTDMVVDLYLEDGEEKGRTLSSLKSGVALLCVSTLLPVRAGWSTPLSLRNLIACASRAGGKTRTNVSPSCCTSRPSFHALICSISASAVSWCSSLKLLSVARVDMGGVLQ